MARLFAFMLTLMLISVAFGDRIQKHHAMSAPVAAGEVSEHHAADMVAASKPAVEVSAEHQATEENIKEAAEKVAAEAISKHDATALQADAQSTNPANGPSQYASYVKPIVEQIIGGTAVPVKITDTKEAGVVSFYLVGGCPSTFCKAQAQIISYFGDRAVTYWAKPGDMSAEGTPQFDMVQYRNLNTKGKYKNDSNKFGALDKKINLGGEGLGCMGQAEFNGQHRTYIVIGADDKVLISLVYIVTWSTWSGTSDGWMFYQRDDGSGSMFRKQFSLTQKMEFTFKGDEVQLDQVWPDAASLAIA